MSLPTIQIMTFKVYGGVSLLPLHAAASKLHQQTTAGGFCAAHILSKYVCFFKKIMHLIHNPLFPFFS